MQQAFSAGVRETQNPLRGNRPRHTLDARGTEMRTLLNIQSNLLLQASTCVPTKQPSEKQGTPSWLPALIISDKKHKIN